MFGHQHVTHQQESLPIPRFFEHFHKQIPGPDGAQELSAFIKAKRNKMQVALSVVAFQVSPHRRRTHPFFQKGWATLVSSPRGEVQKWYPLLVRRRQAETLGESSGPPAAEWDV